MQLTPYQIDVIEAKICPYCKSSTEVVSETDIYGREYSGKALKSNPNIPTNEFKN